VKSKLVAAAVSTIFLAASIIALGAAGDTAVIHMKQQTFAPAKMVVAPGATVSWINDDTVPHSVTADDGRFDSGPILPGQSFKWTAATVGDVAYHCLYHPSMTATVTVRK
jgi:plastocyanin